MKIGIKYNQSGIPIDAFVGVIVILINAYGLQYTWYSCLLMTLYAFLWFARLILLGQGSRRKDKVACFLATVVLFSIGSYYVFHFITRE